MNKTTSAPIYVLRYDVDKVLIRSGIQYVQQQYHVVLMPTGQVGLKSKVNYDELL